MSGEMFDEMTPQQLWLNNDEFVHPGAVNVHPIEDCPICVEIGDWATCVDSMEWIELHRQLWEETNNV